MFFSLSVFELISGVLNVTEYINSEHLKQKVNFCHLCFSFIYMFKGCLNRLDIIFLRIPQKQDLEDLDICITPAPTFNTYFE